MEAKNEPTRKLSAAPLVKILYLSVSVSVHLALSLQTYFLILLVMK